ncbi:MAG: cytochrome b/b6 domain-containing protein [Anaerolineae bacterium]
MKTNKQKHNWLIDAALFIGLLLSFWLELTGVAVHQWLGIAIGLGAGYHLLTHWTWVKSVTDRFFKQTSGQARLYYVIDAAVLIGLATIVVTGLVISTWLNLTLTNFAAWKSLHVIASMSTLLAVVVKIGLHWRWIISTARRHILPKAEPTAQLRAAPVTAGNNLGRREFLRLMGGVSTMAIIATIGAADALKASASAAATTSSTPPATTTTSQNAASCAVLCNRRCSYPGQCRRYVDSNGNGRCDNGECA